MECKMKRQRRVRSWYKTSDSVMPGNLLAGCRAKYAQVSEDEMLKWLQGGEDYVTGSAVYLAENTGSRAILAQLFILGNEVSMLAVVHRLIDLDGDCLADTAEMAREVTGLLDDEAQLLRLFQRGDESVKREVVKRLVTLRD